MSPPLLAQLLERRDCPAPVGLAVVGGELVAFGPSGVTRSVVAFSPEFRGGGSVAVEPLGDVLVGAGPGGGPVVAEFDGRTWVPHWAVYVGNPDSRDGVRDLAAYLPPVERNPSPVRAAPDPDSPGDPAAVQQALDDGLGAEVAGRLAAAGYRVLVYAAPSVGELPQFDPGPTGLAGDRRTWLQVTAATTTAGISYVRQDLTGPVLHEAGHGVMDLLATADDLAAWDALWRATDWKTFPAGAAPVDYFRLNRAEAFAESFALWCRGAPTLAAGVREFFDSRFG